MELVRLDTQSLSAFRRESGGVRQIMVGGEVTNLATLACQDVFVHMILKDENGRVLIREKHWVGGIDPQTTEAFQVVLTIPEASAKWPNSLAVEVEFNLKGKAPRHQISIDSSPQ